MIAEDADAARKLIAAPADQRTADARRLVADAALTAAGESIDPATRATAITLLADELARWFVSLLAELGADEGDPDRDGLATFDADEARAAAEDPEPFRMLWLDAALVRVLANVDPDQARTAREHRVIARDDPALRWKLWAPPVPPTGLVRFAAVLWSARVRERWQRAGASPPAFTRGVADGRLLPLMSRVTMRPQPDEPDDGTIRNPRGEVVGHIDVTAVEPALVRIGVGMFSTTIGHKLVRHCALKAHAATIRGDHRPELITFDGGFLGLAHELGVDRNPGTARALLEAGQYVRLTTPGVEIGGLWTWREVKAAPGRRACLEMHLSPWVFLPGAGTDLKVTQGNSLAARERRRLVPVLRDDPPHRMLANRAEWGLAWSVAFGLVIMFVDQAEELANDGAVHVDAKAWARLLEDAGLCAARLPVLRDGMLGGDGTAPALLERVGHDRYTLAPAHAAELAYIREGGSLRVRGRMQAARRAKR